jgi:hypothetical protein
MANAARNIKVVVRLEQTHGRILCLARLGFVIVTEPSSQPLCQSCESKMFRRQFRAHAEFRGRRQISRDRCRCDCEDKFSFASSGLRKSQLATLSQKGETKNREGSSQEFSSDDRVQIGTAIASNDKQWPVGPQHVLTRSGTKFRPILTAGIRRIFRFDHFWEVLS